MKKREAVFRSLPEGVRIEYIFEPVTLPEEYWGGFVNELFMITAYQGKLYFAPNQRGIWEFDGEKCVQVVTNKLVRDVFESAVIFNGNLIIGIGDGASKMSPGMLRPCSPLVAKYDGKEWKIIKIPGAEGRWHINGLAIYQNELYAGVSGQIWKSSDGENWTLDFDTGRDKHLPAASWVIGEELYFGEADEWTECYIYRKSKGKWDKFKKVKIPMVNWSGSDRISYGDWAFLGTFGPKPGCQTGICIFNGERFLRLLEQPSSWLGKGSYSYHAFYPQGGARFIEGKMYINTGAGTTAWAHGEVWTWDGLRLLKLLELPYSVGGVEFLKGRFYFSCHTVVCPEAKGNEDETEKYASEHSLQLKAHQQRETDVRKYNSNYAFILSADPAVLFRYAQQPPLIKRIWVDTSISANTTLNSDDDGGVLLPVLGYQRKTLYIKDNSSADLIIEIDPDGTGSYEVLHTEKLNAKETRAINIKEGACFLKIRVKQGSKEGILNGRLILE